MDKGKSLYEVALHKEVLLELVAGQDACCMRLSSTPAAESEIYKEVKELVGAAQYDLVKAADQAEIDKIEGKLSVTKKLLSILCKSAGIEE